MQFYRSNAVAHSAVSQHAAIIRQAPDLQATPSDRGDNALKLAGDGFGDRFERWISNLLHGYCRVDGGYFDLATPEVLHDHVAWQHGSDLIIGGQCLVRQRGIARAEDPIVPKIDVELFLHRRFDIDFGQNTKSFGFE